MGLGNLPGDIITRLGNSDPAAFDEVYRALHPAVYYIANKIVENPPEAEDITQETFFRFYKKSTSIKTVEHIEGFLFTTAKNACYDYLKSKYVHNTVHKAIQNNLPKEEEIENQIIKADLLRRVYNEIANLPEKQRQVMQTTIVQHLSNDEAAEKLNTTSANIRMHKTNAIKSLRLLLDKNMVLFFLLVTLY